MNDTVKLAKEACRGCKYATEGISIARGYSKSGELSHLLESYEKEHKEIKSELSKKIRTLGEDEYNHPKIGAAMTKLHTNVMLTMDSSSKKIAELMINGCNMGIKSLAKEKNKNRFADKESRELTERLISTEQRMAKDLLAFL